MPQSIPGESMHRKVLTVSEPQFLVIADFADYSGLKNTELVTMLIEEHKLVCEAASSSVYTELRALYDKPRQILGSIIDAEGQSQRIPYKLFDSTHEYYQRQAARLIVSTAWLIRTAFFNGLALEMETERYTPTFPENISQIDRLLYLKNFMAPKSHNLN